VSTLLYGANDNSVESRMGLNELHTMLRDAVQKEDYMEAGRISSVMMTRLYGDDPDVSEEELKARRRRMSWKGLGAAPWLTDRLDALNFTFPTTIQINAMEAVNAILNTTTEMVESTSLEQRVGNYDKDMGIVISGTTGSGKTLAYLVPLLSTLSDSLFARQRIRVGDEEKVGDTTGDLLDRVALVTSPVVRSNTKNPTKQGGPIATGASLATLGKSGKDVRSPLAVIVVPTRELGVQTSIELFELIGGSIKTNPTDFAGKANYFKYKGPKGIRISCVLDEAEVAYGLQLQTDIVITMPEFVGKLIETGDIIASKVRVVAFDEADLGLEQTKAEDLKLLFDDVAEEHELSRLTFLVGASVTKSLGDLAVRSHILPQGKSYIASATRFAPLGSDTDELMPDASRLGEESKTASLKDLDLCLHPGLVHERAIVKNNTGLIVLTRLLRKELQKYENVATQVSGPKATQPPRVVVFFPDEAQAKAAIAPLRDAMWGEHKLCVLLPKIGVSPLDIMEDFKNNETTVMLATPNSVRGLDFPALTHVYTLYLPMDDPREYVHLAGRVGRVGQSGNVLGDGAHVVSILKEDEANKMNDLAKTLGFEFTDIEATPDVFAFSDGDLDDDDDDDDDDSIESKVRVETAMDKSTLDKMRRNLEDSISMGDLWDDETKSSIPNDFIDAVNEYDDYDGDGEPEDEEEGAFQ
jgi:superfamily II DNA/RNA helicase